MSHDRIIFWEVDAQEDFLLPGGKLYVPGAEKIIPNIKRLVGAACENRLLLVSSGDAHTPEDPEFKVFPPHCVKGTSGAQIVPEGLAARRLTIPNDASYAWPKNLLEYQQIVLEKQTLDVFNNPKSDELVQLLGPRAEYIVFGVVTEYCVRCAVIGLLERGRKVAIVRDAIETLQPEQGARTLSELEALGARLITTQQAIAMAEALVPEKVGNRSPGRNDAI
jgi:nicotinamidase/pyrazinamidase